ncbi:prolipoprotein diacylglyceryl transferase [Spiribacter pallidus]|jgi:phosphatidylglycerol:prolipoprotein diacylglycerol transferase|uniref:Phosphatidylglycerol--prolipoprotein diacylglyceryl transferase n=1 Tax=Spiribacter pallidus TaxID=1987936 RepID=A0ABV3TE94_9GAMM
MLQYPAIDPVAISIGPLDIHWYGVMYAIGFGLAWWLGRLRARRPDTPVGPAQMDDLLLYGAIGVVLGGRIGYILFYAADAWLADPLSLLRVWEGGMSFHGGLLGVIVAMALYARRHRIPALALGDFIAPLVPPGLAAGRLGNFINGELWGAPTQLPWGMVYPPLGPEPRHPSQLYEMALEGLVLFALLWWFSRRPRPAGAVTGFFLIGYGLARFAVEFVRLPDAHLGYLLAGMTMGQLLSLPMIAIGVMLIAAARRQTPSY